MSLCIVAGAKSFSLAITAFTVMWTHSIEQTAWQEDWRVSEAGLVIQEARIKGSGAGMEPPADATFDGEWWHYKPNLPPRRTVLFARSGHAGTWTICARGQCMDFDGQSKEAQQPVKLKACAPYGMSSVNDRKNKKR